MASIYSKFPQINNIKIRELSFDPIIVKSQRNRIPAITKYLQLSTEIVKKKSKEHTEVKPKTKPVISKIDTNRKENSSSLDYQDIKFESVKWSGGSVLHQGFFNLPSIKKNQNYVHHYYFNTSDKERNVSLNNKHNSSIEELEEMPNISRSNSRIPKKFTQIKTPWTFQTASYLTPHDE